MTMMRTSKLNHFFIAFALCLCAAKGFASETQKPLDARPLVPISLKQYREIVDAMPNDIKHTIFNGEPKWYPEGVMDQYGENIDIYIGDFSNEGMKEYLFLAAEAGSIGTDTIIGVYRIDHSQWINLKFNKIVSQQLFGYNDGDLSKFYLSMARPISYQLNGKTYLSFRSSLDQHSSNCDYLWEGNTFSLKKPAARECILERPK